MHADVWHLWWRYGMEGIVDAQIAKGIPANRIVVSGFSQGVRIIAWRSCCIQVLRVNQPSSNPSNAPPFKPKPPSTKHKTSRCMRYRGLAESASTWKHKSEACEYRAAFLKSSSNILAPALQYAGSP